MQTELNTRLKFLAAGTPLLENFTDIFVEALSFQFPSNFYATDGNLVEVEMLVSASEDGMQEIQIEIEDESTNTVIMGTSVIDLGVGDSFLGRFSIKFIALPSANLVVGIAELFGAVNGTTVKYKPELLFAIEDTPCDLAEVLTCRISIRTPDNVNTIQSVYAVASTNMVIA